MKTDPIFGLGDLAYYVFRPVVYSIDLVWGTDLRACDKCKERRANGMRSRAQRHLQFYW